MPRNKRQTENSQNDTEIDIYRVQVISDDGVLSNANRSIGYLKSGVDNNIIKCVLGLLYKLETGTNALCIKTDTEENQAFLIPYSNNADDLATSYLLNDKDFVVYNIHNNKIRLLLGFDGKIELQSDEIKVLSNILSILTQQKDFNAKQIEFNSLVITALTPLAPGSIADMTAANNDLTIKNSSIQSTIDLLTQVID